MESVAGNSSTSVGSAKIYLVIRQPCSRISFFQMVSGNDVNNKPVSFPPPPTALPIPNETMKQSMDTKTDVLKMMLGVTPATSENAKAVRNEFF